MSISSNAFCEGSSSLSFPLSRIKTKAANGVTLFPEPPPDQLKKVRKEKALKAEKIEKVEKKLEKKIQVSKVEPVIKKATKKVTPQTLFDSSENLSYESNVINSKKEMIKKKIVSVKETLSDNDFIILVSEFYESLKPLQKKAFERERVAMTCEQFRLYMTPILKRKSNKKIK